jgi:XTP/dITP diphosphohydrolase
MMNPNKKMIVATRNAGKTEEFREAFAPLGIEIADLREFPGMPPIEENGATFAENALIKARAAAEWIGLPVMADDSGLCVDALGGAPGVYSARYAGEHATDAENNAKLLRELAASVSATRPDSGGPDVFSTARFVCSIALYDPQKRTCITAEGTVEGMILTAPRGSGGFGYDPLFWLPEYGKSMAELSTEEKNRISHRGRALRHLLEQIDQIR